MARRFEALLGFPVKEGNSSAFTGRKIEVMKPDGANITVTVQRIVDEEGNDMESPPQRGTWRNRAARLTGLPPKEALKAK